MQLYKCTYKIIHLNEYILYYYRFRENVQKTSKTKNLLLKKNII